MGQLAVGASSVLQKVSKRRIHCTMFAMEQPRQNLVCLHMVERQKRDTADIHNGGCPPPRFRRMGSTLGTRLGKYHSAALSGYIYICPKCREAGSSPPSLWEFEHVWVCVVQGPIGMPQLKAIKTKHGDSIIGNQ